MSQEQQNPPAGVYIGIVSITIILTEGTDMVFLRTAFPCPFAPKYDNSPLNLSFHATADTGEKYVKENFPMVPYKVIGSRSKPQNPVSLVNEDGSGDSPKEREKEKKEKEKFISFGENGGEDWLDGEEYGGMDEE